MDSDQQKSTHGALATFVWLFGTIYLFWSNFGFSSLISWQAGLFAIVGMFLSAVIVGGIAYLIQLAVASLLTRTISESGPTKSFVLAVQATGFLLLAVDVYVAWFAVSRSFAYFFGSGV